MNGLVVWRGILYFVFVFCICLQMQGQSTSSLLKCIATEKDKYVNATSVNMHLLLQALWKDTCTWKWWALWTLLSYHIKYYIVLCFFYRRPMAVFFPKWYYILKATIFLLPQWPTAVSFVTAINGNDPSSSICPRYYFRQYILFLYFLCIQFWEI